MFLCRLRSGHWQCHMCDLPRRETDVDTAFALPYQLMNDVCWCIFCFPVRARIWGSTTLLITAYLTDCCRRVDFRHARHTFFQACAALWGDGADVLPWGGDGADALRLGDGAETLPSICSRLCRCAFVQCNHDGPASTGQNPEKCQWIEFEQRSMRCSSMLHACAANVTANVILKHARQKTYVRARKSFAVSHEPSQGCFCCRSVGLVRST
jgi:hypothetical protein